VERQYVAIDLHRRRSMIVRQNAAGEELAVVRIDNDPVALSAAIAEAGPNPDVAIEACYGWYWAVDLLQAEGASVHLVHPGGMGWEGRRVKNDYRDCCDLLDRMRLGKLPEAWIAPVGLRGLREMIRTRAKLVAIRTGFKAQVHAVLAKHGLLPPVSDIWGVAGGEWLDGLDLPAPYAYKIGGLLELIDTIDDQVGGYERIIHDWLADDVGYRAIQAIDGVGPTIGAIFVAEIGDIRRFTGPDKLCSWAGLTPRLRESDVKTRRGHITKQGSAIVRWAAVEAVSRVRGTPKIKRDYQRIAERRGKNIAKVAAARRLITLVFYGLRDGEIRCLAQAETG
jgi:transposase